MYPEPRDHDSPGTRLDGVAEVVAALALACGLDVGPGELRMHGAEGVLLLLLLLLPTTCRSGSTRRVWPRVTCSFLLIWATAAT